MYSNETHTAHRGFTLVEILVVASIIGVLVGIVLISVDQVRDKNEDERRIADLQQLELALKLYHSANEEYPNTGGNWYGLCDNCASGNQQLSGSNGYIPDLAPQYIKQLPVDPRDTRTDWSGYLYRSDGTDYKLMAHGEGPEDFASEPAFLDPRRDGGSDDCALDGTGYWAWAIYTQGATCW